MSLFRLLWILLLLNCMTVEIQPLRADTWVRVDKAVDGDTLLLKNGHLVRYVGINTPEIDHLNHRAEPFGWQAQKFNQELVDGKRVRLVPGMVNKDRYGRFLANVYDEQGRMVSQLLIFNGLGYFYPHPSDDKATDDRLLAAQRSAMKRLAGIWKTKFLQKGPCIGNRGSKRFHNLQCPLAKTIAVHRVVHIKTHWEAYWQGYAPCGRCLPSLIKKELKHH